MIVTLTQTQPRAPKVLRINQVIEMIGLSKASIYRLAKLGKFPKSFKIGISAVGWLQSEIEMWIAERQIDGTAFEI